MFIKLQSGPKKCTLFIHFSCQMCIHFLGHSVYIYLHENTRYLCQILMRLEQFRRIWEKYSDISCHENLFIGGRVVLCEQTVVDRQREADDGQI